MGSKLAKLMTGDKLDLNSRHGFIPPDAQVFALKSINSNRLLIAYFKSKNVGEEEKLIVVSKMKQITLDKGEVLCRQGDPAHKFFVIAKGSLNVACNETYANTVKAGDCVGELGFVNNTVRAASLRAATRCTVYAMDRKSFLEITMKEITHADLQSNPLFAGLSDDDWGDLGAIVSTRHFQQGETILSMDNDPSHWYIIAIGHATVDCGRNLSNELIKSRGQLGPNSYFGEESIMRATQQPYNITAHDDVTCLVINKSDFQAPCLLSVRILLQIRMEISDGTINANSPQASPPMRRASMVNGADDEELEFKHERVHVAEQEAFGFNCAIQFFKYISMQSDE